LNATSHTTRITKRRWDRLLLPIATVSGIAALVFGSFTGFWHGLQVPALTLGLWAYLRHTTPIAGVDAVSINGNPKVQALLKWLVSILLITATWALVDTQLLGNSIHHPLTRLQIGGFIAMVILLLAGVFVIEGRYRTLPTDTENRESSANEL
jgi:hypothetical protein